MRFWMTVEILGTFVSLAVLVTAAVLEPHESGQGTTPALFKPCPYRQQTGNPCLSCGMTTSFANMIRLRPTQAFEANPAGLLLFLITLATPPWLIHAAVTRQDPFRFTRHPIWRWLLPAFAAVVAVVWIVRA